MIDNPLFDSIVQVLLLLLVLFTSLQQVRKDVWWVRMSDFPHVQLTFLTFILFGINLFLPMTWFQPGILILGLAALMYQSYIILPYTKLWQKQLGNLTSEPHLGLISILECNVLQYNEQYDLLTRLIKKYNPDLIILLETDVKWEQGIKSATDEYPFTLKHPLDNTYGMLLYSKFPIVTPKINHLISEEIPSFEMGIILNGNYVHCFVVHPSPPSPTENYKSTERDAEMILVGKKAEKIDYPIIVAGDLNDVAWSHTTRLFQRVSKLRDPRIGRGFFNTFHANYPFLRWPLDHVFFSNHWKIKSIKTLEKIGSDHLPVFIEAALVASTDSPVVINELDKEDKAEIKEKLDAVS